MKIPAYSFPLVVALGCSQLAAGANQTDDSPTYQIGTDSAFNFQYLIQLGDALTGGADIAPVLGAAKNITAGDMTSFSKQFYSLAFETKAQAEDPENAYNPINVRDTWFSAAQYFRRADFYLHRNWNDPLIESLWEEQTAAFNKAIAALPIPGERIRIPAPEGNFTVEAIWYGASTNKDEKLPTLIVGNGYDAAQEDSYHYYVAFALARGWNCITYEGPGQPTVRRNQGLGFIYQWERVVSPVVDYIYSKKSDVVDTDRLVLLGNSFGGFLAARAAAFESRLSAVVLIDGIWDTYAGFSAQMPASLLSMYTAGNYTEFDRTTHALRNAGKFPTSAAWGIDQGLWSFKTHSSSKFFNESKNYDLKPIADKIRMPVFIGSAQYENFFPGQAQEVKNALGSSATLHHFNGVSGLHTQTAAGQELTRSIFAWLNKTLRKSGGA